MLDASAPTGDFTLPGAHVVREPDVVPQKRAAPAIVIAGDHQDRQPSFAQFCECGHHPVRVARNDALPFEPELEEIAVDEQRAGASRKIAKKREQRTFDLVVRKAEMSVGDHITGRRKKHVHILVRARTLYKGGMNWAIFAVTSISVHE